MENFVCLLRKIFYFIQLKQNLEETKILLYKEETNETNEGLKFDENLFEIPGIKLEEIENKNKAFMEEFENN